VVGGGGGAARAGPPALLARSPYAGLALSAGLAVASVWLGLALAYRIDRLPPSTAIVSVAVGCYVLAALSALLRRRPAHA
jgi:ABC-type Mn2+/Zn2+ transport system permease subunit